MWQMTCDKWHFFFFFLFYTTFFLTKFLKVSIRGNFIVLVLLFATIERFGVSRMWDFFYNLRVVFKYTETLVLCLNFHALLFFYIRPIININFLNKNNIANIFYINGKFWWMICGGWRFKKTKCPNAGPWRPILFFLLQ